MQENLRKGIANYGGEILVGNAVAMGIPNSKNIQYLISAPTMRVPEDVSNTINAYLAFKAALKVAKDLGLNSILCPGLATTTGKMPVCRASFQMHCAYYEAFTLEKALGQPPLSVYDLRDYASMHKAMKEYK
jgi:O-acetyl-ADP-ribose deacetylase (regulator of RNase III)